MRLTKSFLPFAFLALTSPTIVLAASLKEVGEAVRNQDYETAFQQLDVLTRQNHPVAQYLMGMMYEFGRGTEKDTQKAAMWYRKAADLGHDGAMTSLGLLYVKGDGVNQDFAEAVKLLSQAAAKGNSNAQYNLALRYAKGEGVLQDTARAFELYLDSAKQNNVLAQYNAAYAYATGTGVAVDNVQALKWAELSALQRHPQGPQLFSFLSSKAKPEEREQADQLVTSWYEERGLPRPELRRKEDEAPAAAE